MGTGTELSKNGIDPERREAISEVLGRLYRGEAPLRDLLSADTIPRTTYYRVKKAHPEEFSLIDREARKSAAVVRSSERVAFEARHEGASQKLQTDAAVGMHPGIVMLADIAAGKIREVKVDVTKYNRKEKKWETVEEVKSIIPYPRDIISAMSTLHAIAKEGVKPEYLDLPLGSTVEPEETGPPELLPMFTMPTAFSKVEVTTPDGRKFTSTVEDDSIVEIEEDGSEV